ncbi:MAG: siderophore-interacting protein [Actinomycetota bacterium]
MSGAPRALRTRKEPPPLRQVTVIERVELSPRLLRLTLEGEGLRDLLVTEPAASIRLLVPTPGTDELVIPTWNGNEFLLPDGNRPALRTFTPLRVDNDAGRLDIEVVRHPGGAVSSWAETVGRGAPAAISGPGSGYEIPDDADRLLVLGDETAIPAVSQLLDAAGHLDVEAHVEVVRGDAQLDLGVTWHVTEAEAAPGASLVEVVTALTELPDGTYVWAAGEAASMQAIRTHLFQTLGVPRGRTAIRGYWKPPRG